MKFLAHLVYQPKSLIQSCFVRRRRRHWYHRCLCTPPLATGLDIETSYLVYICTYAPHSPKYIHIKYLVILRCSFQMAVILLLFFYLLSCFKDRHRDVILHMLVYLFFTYIHKRNNATVTYFVKFMSIKKNIHILFTSLRHHVL